MRRTAAIATILLLLVGCGGGGGGANATVKAGSREITVNARSYAFSPKKIDVRAGENIAIVLHSQDQAHDFTIEKTGLVVSVDGGKTAKGGFRLAKPGTYTFFCSITGHRASGMEGTITAS